MPGPYDNQLNATQSAAQRQALAHQQAMIRFNQMRAQALQKPNDYQQLGDQAAPGVDTAMAWHPSWILNYVANKIKAATGQ